MRPVQMSVLRVDEDLYHVMFLISDEIHIVCLADGETLLKLVKRWQDGEI